MRFQKNASYILLKMTDSRSPGKWNKEGEFIFNSNAVRGSHMMDLIKHLSLSHKTSQKHTAVQRA